MTMNRVLTNQAETQINDGKKVLPDNSLVSEPLFRVNIKNTLVTMARNLELLLLEQKTVIAETINKMMDAITSCRQKQRPGRKYERVSRRPEARWKRRKSSASIATIAT